MQYCDTAIKLVLTVMVEVFFYSVLYCYAKLMNFTEKEFPYGYNKSKVRK